MTGRINQTLKKLACVCISILFITVSAKATLVDANVVEEGLEYYIRIDKSVYDLGETIQLLHRLTNVGNEILNIAELGIYTLSLELNRPQGETLFSPYFGPPFPPMPPGFPDIVMLNPGECIETRWHITSGGWGTDGEWFEEPFASVGQYSITSKYDNSFADEGPFSLVPDALHFAIIPEPGSIALLGVGLASLLVRKKGRLHYEQL